MTSHLTPLMLSIGLLGNLVIAGDSAIKASWSCPNDAATIAPAFMAFSVQASLLPDYAGTTDKPNTITKNLLNVLRDQTGAPPLIRVGGNDQDYTTWDDGQQEPVYTAKGGDRAYKIGPSYFDSYKALPAGTKLSFPFNNGKTDQSTIDSNVAMAKAACKAVGNMISFWEYGNEPDLYHSNGHRDDSFTMEQYSKEWTKGTDAVSAAIKEACPGMHTTFMGPSLTGPYGSHPDGQSSWTAANILKAGMSDNHHVTAISTHCYMGSPSSGKYFLMDHVNTKKKVGQLKDAMDASRGAYGKQLPFFVGEGNSLYSGGLDGESNAFQAALWTLDFSLAAAAAGVRRVHFHQASDASYNAWFFNSDSATTRPPFYGHLATAALVGKEQGVRIAPVEIGDSEVAYAAYVGGKLARLAVINFGNQGGSNTYTVPVQGGVKASVMRLSADSPEETDASKITFGGVSFDKSGKPSGQYQPEEGKVEGGNLSVKVKDAEAVIISFQAGGGYYGGKPPSPKDGSVAKRFTA